jgi:hypothetical protein
VQERLAITLRFLATGDTYATLQYLFRVSKRGISNIIPEVCMALVELKQYIQACNLTFYHVSYVLYSQCYNTKNKYEMNQMLYSDCPLKQYCSSKECSGNEQAEEVASGL